VLRALIDPAAIAAHRARALDPDRPSIRGTAQNPDVFFQAREAGEPFYAALPRRRRRHDGAVRRADRAALPAVRLRGPPRGRAGDRDDGLGRECVHETVEHLVARGEKVGVVKVRLFRPFSVERTCSPRCRARRARSRCSIAPRSPARAASRSCRRSRGAGRRGGQRRSRDAAALIGGRYGLASKEFTPAMVQGRVRRAGGGRAASAVHLGIATTSATARCRTTALDSSPTT
jgi:pyruvate-ferredoxin/flavodoxin oxidoreductase